MEGEDVGVWGSYWRVHLCNGEEGGGEGEGRAFVGGRAEDDGEGRQDCRERVPAPRRELNVDLGDIVRWIQGDVRIMVMRGDVLW